MDKTYSTWQKILLNILYIAMIFTLTTLIGDVIGLELSLFNQFIIVIIISTIIKSFTKYPLFLLISLIIGFLVMLLIDTYKFSVFLHLASKVSKIFSNITGNLQGNESIAKENINSVYYLVVMLISIYTSIIIYRTKIIFLLIPVYLPIFLAYWYSFIDRSFNLVVVFLFFFLILLGFKGYKISKLSSPIVFKRWLRTTIIYSLIIVILAFFIPKTNDFINFPWLQEKVYNTFPMIDDLRHYKEYNRETGSSELFDFSTSGYSKVESDLGGPLVQTDKKVMIVETKEPVYLRGNVKNFYTGKRWESPQTAPVVVETEYNTIQNTDISGLTQDEKDKSFREEDLIIAFDSFSSSTIFAPYKPMIINSNIDLNVSINEYDIITSKEGIYENESYFVRFLKPLPYNRIIENNLEKNKKDLFNLDLYLQIPDNITDRTKELSYSLVENLDTDYEKAITIQNYLRNNYTYNLDVDYLPEDEEFIDYFLFQQQEGYCTYYASAMAVMLRLENIPTRYVEGYIVDENIAGNRYQVRQKHAHTWVEAFIEPVGWISFEPTAAYGYLGDTDYPVEDEPSPNMDEDMLPEKDNFPIIPDEDVDDLDNNEDLGSDTQTKDGKGLRKPLILLIFLSLIIFLTLRVITRYIKYNSKKRFLNALSNSEHIIYSYKDIIDILSILDFPLQLGETHFEYANRVSYKFTDLKDFGIKDITDLFVKIKYANMDANDVELLSLVNYKNNLDKRLKNKLGKLNYFYRKYINVYFKRRKEIP